MDNTATLYPAPFVMTFQEISLPAWFAIIRNGGSIRPSMRHTTPVWEITFPEGTVFDGPTMGLQFKSMSYHLPDGHNVWSGSDRFHMYSEDDRDESRHKFHMTPNVVFDRYNPSRIGVSHYVRVNQWHGYYARPQNWF